MTPFDLTIWDWWRSLYTWVIFNASVITVLWFLSYLILLWTIHGTGALLSRLPPKYTRLTSWLVRLERFALTIWVLVKPSQPFGPRIM